MSEYERLRVQKEMDGLALNAEEDKQKALEVLYDHFDAGITVWDWETRGRAVHLYVYPTGDEDEPLEFIGQTMQMAAKKAVARIINGVSDEEV